MKELFEGIEKSKIVIFLIILLLFIGSTIGAFTITDETWKMVSTIVSPTSAIIETLFSLKVVLKIKVNLTKTVNEQKIKIKNLEIENNNSLEIIQNLKIENSKYVSTISSLEMRVNSDNITNNYNGVMPKKLKQSDYDFHKIITENLKIFKQRYDYECINDSWTLRVKDDDGNLTYGDYEEFMKVMNLLEDQATIFSNAEIEQKAQNLKAKLIKYWNDLSNYSQTYGRENAKIDLHYTMPYCISEHPELFEELNHREITQKDLENADRIQKKLDENSKNLFEAYDDYLKTFVKNSD